jgi:hypothetical protein
MTVQPVIGQRYYYPEKSHEFVVVALDISNDKVEIQYFDGTTDEMKVTTWYDTYLQVIKEPELLRVGGYS